MAPNNTDVSPSTTPYKKYGVAKCLLLIELALIVVVYGISTIKVFDSKKMLPFKMKQHNRHEGCLQLKK